MKIVDTTRNELIKYHLIQLDEAEQHRRYAKRAMKRAEQLASAHRKAIQRLEAKLND